MIVTFIFYIVSIAVYFFSILFVWPTRCYKNRIVCMSVYSFQFESAFMWELLNNSDGKFIRTDNDLLTGLRVPMSMSKSLLTKLMLFIYVRQTWTNFDFIVSLFTRRRLVSFSLTRLEVPNQRTRSMCTKCLQRLLAHARTEF